MIERMERDRREREERARLWIETPLPEPRTERRDPESDGPRVITIEVL